MKTTTPILIAAALSATLSARAADPIYSSKDKAIGGYDTVSYFTENKAVKGSGEHSHTWKGATWHFSSAANLALFKADPQKYAPQYGGYCAYAAAQNDLVKSDPKLFDFYGGKLYLNYSKRTVRKWKVDRPGMIKRGDANYPKLIAK